jgi:ADP-heptose:LPS heptosyltransferase
VVLGLPALIAIRERFPEARITTLLGKPGADIVRLAGVSDDQILVDRVELRDGAKTASIAKILSLVRLVRSRKFDLVIDLNSLYETNLLGYLSGAKYRLYANRENRSLDRLSNFPVKPPAEDKSLHHTDRYLAVLEPLGICDSRRSIKVSPTDEALKEADEILESFAKKGKTLIGLFLGAGHPTRRWSIENFVEAARRLSKEPEITLLVLLGPEERDLRPGLAEKFGNDAVVLNELPLMTFFAILSRLDVLVSGDTGPMHLGAAAGAGIVLLSQLGSPLYFRPIIDKLRVIEDRPLAEITVSQVENAVKELLV